MLLTIPSQISEDVLDLSALRSAKVVQIRYEPNLGEHARRSWSRRGKEMLLGMTRGGIPAVHRLARSSGRVVKLHPPDPTPSAYVHLTGGDQARDLVHYLILEGETGYSIDGSLSVQAIAITDAYVEHPDKLAVGYAFFSGWKFWRQNSPLPAIKFSELGVWEALDDGIGRVRFEADHW
jgi:hypothetical protein